MQLDADDDGEPFFKPQAIAPAPLRPPPHDEPLEQTQEERGAGVESQAATAAAVTAEMEE